MEGGTAAFISIQCFEMLRNLAGLMIEWQPNGSILIGHQLTVVSQLHRRQSCNMTDSVPLVDMSDNVPAHI